MDFDAAFSAERTNTRRVDVAFEPMGELGRPPNDGMSGVAQRVREVCKPTRALRLTGQRVERIDDPYLQEPVGPAAVACSMRNSWAVISRRAS